MYSILNITMYFIISIFFIILLLYIVKKYDVIKLKNNKIIVLVGLIWCLAIGVFLIHYLVTYQWTFTGMWMAISLENFNNIGEASISLFFIIIGYLFTKTIANKKFQTKSFNKFNVGFDLYLLYGLITYMIIDFLHKGSLPLFITIISVLFSFKFIETSLNKCMFVNCQKLKI